MKHAMYAVDPCDSLDCEGNRREFRVWGKPSNEFRVHEIICPDCGKHFEREVKLQEILKVDRANV